MITMCTDQPGICSSAGERGHGRVEPVAHSHLQQDCQLRYRQVSCRWTSVLRITRNKIRVIYLKITIRLRCKCVQIFVRMRTEKEKRKRGQKRSFSKCHSLSQSWLLRIVLIFVHFVPGICIPTHFVGCRKLSSEFAASDLVVNRTDKVKIRVMYCAFRFEFHVTY